MTQQWKENEGDGEEDVQMPLGTGGEAPAEEYSGPAKPKINTSTLALVAAFAAGLVVLYFLGLGNKPRPASAERLQRDKIVSDNILKLLTDKGQQASVETFLKDSRLLLARLDKYFSPSAVPQNLPGNPFEHEVPHVEEPITAFQSSPVIPPDHKEATKLREAAEYFATLKLQMIMLGSPSMAMINSRMVTVGTQLEMFSITAIKNDSVTLTLDFNHQEFNLKSSSPDMNKH
jgi:hypothetical protein